MTKTVLHQFYLDLIPNLYGELFFFLPEREIGKDIIEKIDFFKNHDVLNKIYVIDYHQGPMEYQKDRKNEYILLKDSKLEQNIFKLLEKKSEVKQHEFQYVLNQYFELVECLFYISSWMNNNLIQIIKKDNTIIGLFHMQFLNYKKHFEGLVKHFYPNREAIPKGNFNAHEIIETYFPDISISFKQTSDIDVESIKKETKRSKVNPTSNLEITTVIQQKTDKKEKKRLVADEEAEKILLETFFNININIKIERLI